MPALLTTLLHPCCPHHWRTGSRRLYSLCLGKRTFDLRRRRQTSGIVSSARASAVSCTWPTTYDAAAASRAGNLDTIDLDQLVKRDLKNWGLFTNTNRDLGSTRDTHITTTKVKFGLSS
ncbi:predicted protein [Aspergillus terreus NIH2624]|uniref:Uncharacterized protein n=1 Tax=Aspergillus terreus (strain NIH 2624 / FGSC A1156) TaxID=341663 RepID=Q0D1S9_ASPTN|nr:uncharacterized protein ATEG_00105 [Aspergillus terreus NIH2624]EAU38751.1 predicted protein [Aspergillus terreus NIH2624]